MTPADAAAVIMQQNKRRGLSYLRRFGSDLPAGEWLRDEPLGIGIDFRGAGSLVVRCQNVNRYKGRLTGYKLGSEDRVYFSLAQYDFYANAGTVYADVDPAADLTSSSEYLFAVHSGTLTSAIYVRTPSIGAHRVLFRVRNNPTIPYDFTQSPGPSARYKVAMTWDQTGVRSVIDGVVLHSSDAAINLSETLNATRLGVGESSTDANKWLSPIHKFAFVPRRMTDAELIERTS